MTDTNQIRLALVLLFAGLCMASLTLYDFYLDGHADQRAYQARMAAYMAIPRDYTGEQP